jgi:hypothetical protein
MASDWGRKAKDIASTIGDKVGTTKEALKRGAESVRDTYKEKKDEA